MKKYIKHLILSACASLIPTSLSNAENPSGYGTRIDYLDAQGERMSSISVESSNIDVFSCYPRGENNFFISFPKVSSTLLSRMRFVPWGKEAYSVILENENPDEIELNYSVQTPGQTSRTRSAEEKANVLCGQNIRIFMKVPEGTYPNLDFFQLYTNVDTDGTSLFTSLSGFSGMPWYPYRNAYDAFDPQWRKNMMDTVGLRDGFIKDEKQPNSWYIDIEMPNEPLKIVASYIRPDNELLKTAKNAALAELYAQDFTMSGLPFLNGDPYIMMMVGEYLSEDFISGYMVTERIQPDIYTDFSLFNHGNYWYNTIPWGLCFKWIYHANLVLSQLDRFTFATREARDIAQAQMLALRSHAYWRILQMYAPRWCDSNNGETLCAPLETTFTDENHGPASMNAIVAQCMADLDKAADLMPKNYLRENIIEPDIKVIKGIKMRLALLSEQWSVVKQLSSELLEMVPLTSSADLLGGMFTPTESWIWGAYNNFQLGNSPRLTEEGLYYYSFQSWNSCNGTYNSIWSLGSNAISRDLFLSMSENDVRRQFYVMPETVTRAFRPFSKWYTKESIELSTLFLNIPPSLSILRQPEGVPAQTFYCSLTGMETPVAFGAQTKFFQPGSDILTPTAVVFMRAEEILLSNAEAAFHLGDHAAALDAINCLNGMRIPGHLPQTSCDDIMGEIRKIRKIELWGEGHSWFDQKRWNLPINRKNWEENNYESGNWPLKFNSHNSIEQGNGWRLAVPNRYLQYNPKVTVEALGYKDMEGYTTPATSDSKTVVANKTSIRPKASVMTSKEFYKKTDTYGSVVSPLVAE